MIRLEIKNYNTILTEKQKNYHQTNNRRQIIEQASIFSFQKSVVKTEKQDDDKDANFTKFYELDYESKR